MVRVTLVGAGDIKYHYTELLKIKEKKVELHLNSIAKALKDSDSELIVTPDRGVSFEVAKKYKSFSGKKVTALAPLSDKRWGVKHIQSYLDETQNGKKIVDNTIDTLNWLEHDSTHNMFGDVTLVLGHTLGATRELCGGYYLYKLFGGAKPEAKIAMEKVHPMISAGSRMPFHTIVYSPFVKDSLPMEIEKYIEKLGCKVFYVKNSKELSNLLKKLGK
ncbi:MAG: hypothetical protein WCW44_02390 [archaeon]|jgi:hypothetical protein